MARTGFLDAPDASPQQPVETRGGAFVGYPKARPKRGKQGALEGFLQEFAAIEHPDAPESVLDPRFEEYSKGKNYGELASIASLALPIGYLARSPLQALKGMRSQEQLTPQVSPLISRVRDHIPKVKERMFEGSFASPAFQ